jgi:hypothetical protein
MKIKRRTLEALLYWGTRIGILLVVSVFIFGYFRTSFFTIKEYKVIGIPEKLQEDLVRELKKNGEQKNFKVFENNKILTYSKKSVRTTVLSFISDAKSISIRSSGLHTLHIEVVRYVPLFKSLDGMGMNEEGVLFKSVDYIETLPTLVIASSSISSTTKNSIAILVIKKQNEFIAPEILLAIADFSSRISNVIFQVSHIEIKDDGDIVFTDAGGISSVFIRPQSDFKKVWSVLVSAIDTEPLKSKLVSEKDSLQYLDVRFGNKVFYKFGNTLFQNSTSTVILSDHEKATTTSSH